MEKLLLLISGMQHTDIIDILLAALFFYFLFALFKETRSFSMLIGFVTLLLFSLVFFLVASFFELRTLRLIFSNFWMISVIVFIVVSQNDFKRALTEIGQMRWLRSLFPRRERGTLTSILVAVQVMAARNVGALIAIERENSLKPYQGMGTELDALISSELIRTIFTHYTPLHDGALIIKDDRLVAAGCILPLLDNVKLGHDLGTRHRAALGLAEQTDAVIIVISEETGSISLAAEGRIERNLSIETLRRRLEHELNLVPEENEKEPQEDDAA